MSADLEVQVPPVGESVSEASIGRWFYKDGEMVKKNSPLFEIDSDKASMEVPAEESGKLKILVKEGETVQIGATVAKIDTSAAGAVEESAQAEASEKKSASGGASAPSSSAASGSKPGPSTSASSTRTTSDQDLREYSPSQRRAIRHGKVAVLKPSTSAQTAMGAAATASLESRTPMSSLRRTIANRLIHSQQSTATLTTFNEVDMSAVLEVRSKIKDEFQKKFGVKLGFMSFFTAAVCEAIREFPIVNQYIDGQDIVDPGAVHIGIAVSTERGLVVPVLRDADQLSYAEIEKGIGSLAEKARDGKLSIPEMQGGSFTITNGGVFGSLLSTPILNPPQSGILGMHKTEHRPVAIEKNGQWSVEVRPMMYVALSYDHRLIDGATSVGFLVKVKEYLENVTDAQVLT